MEEFTFLELMRSSHKDFSLYNCSCFITPDIKNSLQHLNLNAAAYGEDLGLQIFVTLRRGSEWPPRTCDVRVRYEQTFGELRKAAAEKLGVPVSLTQLFWHGKELTAVDDKKTLLEMNIHTGFGIQGYDLSVEPEYWPPVRQTPEGLVIDAK